MLLNNRGRIADELLKIIDIGFNGVFSPYEHPELARLINSLTELPRNDIYTELYNTMITGQILIELARIGDIDKNSKKLPISKRLKPALIYIRENYADPQLMTADKIAASPDYKDEDFIIFEPATGFRQRLSAHLFQQEQCPECNKTVSHHKMCRTYDCHGIPFRFVCHACYEKIMLSKGYDGEYYTEADECIDSDY